MGRILQLLSEQRLGRKRYVQKGPNGEEIFCPLAALTGNPETGPDTCPEELAPRWLAYLLPWWADVGTVANWAGLMQQVGELEPRFKELTGEVGRRALTGCQLASLRLVRPYAGSSTATVDRIIEVLLRAGEVSGAELERLSAEAETEYWGHFIENRSDNQVRAARVAHRAAAPVTFAPGAYLAAEEAVWSAAYATAAGKPGSSSSAEAAGIADGLISQHLEVIRNVLAD